MKEELLTEKEKEELLEKTKSPKVIPINLTQNKSKLKYTYQLSKALYLWLNNDAKNKILVINDELLTSWDSWKEKIKSEIDNCDKIGAVWEEANTHCFFIFSENKKEDYLQIIFFITFIRKFIEVRIEIKDLTGQVKSIINNMYDNKQMKTLENLNKYIKKYAYSLKNEYADYIIDTFDFKEHTYKYD